MIVWRGEKKLVRRNLRRKTARIIKGAPGREERRSVGNEDLHPIKRARKREFWTETRQKKNGRGITVVKVGYGRGEIERKKVTPFKG